MKRENDTSRFRMLQVSRKVSLKDFGILPRLSYNHSSGILVRVAFSSYRPNSNRPTSQPMCIPNKDNKALIFICSISVGHVSLLSCTNCWVMNCGHAFRQWICMGR
ncbi:hypothetical protein CEXT_305901 [Caerostris extrusa]|uniref:Uncharacterized protein n=1 Tax=Caerostris extrusa TaxID=172846 RepID=A0AAV4VK71_CAEEX|nr:hypothetical protein CEXT_305901 [Caerostris extrusa]